MREFGKIEILKHKCHICGSRNKILKVEKICPCSRVKDGYKLFCCNCGAELNFIFRKDGYDVDDLITRDVEVAFPNTDTFCIMLHTCERRDRCPFLKFNLLEYLLGHYKGTKAPDHCNRHCCPCVPLKPNCCEKSNYTKLLVNIEQKDKYR